MVASLTHFNDYHFAGNNMCVNTEQNTVDEVFPRIMHQCNP